MNFPLQAEFRQNYHLTPDSSTNTRAILMDQGGDRRSQCTLSYSIIVGRL